MRNAIGFFIGSVGGFALAVVTITVTPAWALPKGHQGQSVCQCGCGVVGGIYDVSVAAPNNDPSQCGNLNNIACTMGPTAGSNNQGKLQDCKGAVVVGLTKQPGNIKAPPGPKKEAMTPPK